MRDNGWCYVAGNTVGPADFCVAGYLYNSVWGGTKVDADKKESFKAIYDKYPKVKAVAYMIARHPPLARYLVNRPERGF